MTDVSSDDDLYFKGMYDEQLKDKNKDNKILVCAKCGSKNIVRVTMVKPVFVNVAIIYKCRHCGYQGEAKEIDSDEK